MDQGLTADDLVAAARKNRRALIEADHDALLAELAASPATASLLTALVDLMRDDRDDGRRPTVTHHDVATCAIRYVVAAEPAARANSR